MSTDPYHPRNHKFLDKEPVFNYCFDDNRQTGTGTSGPPMAGGPLLDPRPKLRLIPQVRDARASGTKPSPEMLALCAKNAVTSPLLKLPIDIRKTIWDYALTTGETIELLSANPRTNKQYNTRQGQRSLADISSELSIAEGKQTGMQKQQARKKEQQDRSAFALLSPPVKYTPRPHNSHSS